MNSPPANATDGNNLTNGNLAREGNDEQTLQWTPIEYAKAISDFSKLRSGAGQNFVRLAEFLEPHQVSSPSGAPRSQEGFATLYRLLPKTSDPDWAHRKISFNSSEEFERLELYRPGETVNNILFLKGYPSPDWLRCIGSKYGLDPEFFRRHLEFESASDPASYLSSVSLPSSSWRMFRLNVTTIQTSEGFGRRTIGSEQRRKEKRVAMEQHLRDILLGELSTGDPMVRHFSTLDATHFSIEQKISIYLHEEGLNWTLLAWTDASKDLSESPNGPWTPSKSSLKRSPTDPQMQPIIKYKPMLALKSHIMSNDGPSQNNSVGSKAVQSASTLHMNYGRTLRPEVMACDALYALREVFELVAQSEIQFLNLCDDRLNLFEDSVYSKDPDCLPNLKNLNQLLYRHLNQNEEAVLSLETVRNTRWPRTSDGQLRSRTEAAAQDLKRDYSQLIKWNRQLHRRCTEAIGLLMNEIVIAESKEATLQATRVGKLTFLAFIFVPLSFTTSFFGMNVKELGAGDQTLSIGYWFLLSIPLLVFGILFFRFDMRGILDGVRFCIDTILGIFRRRRPWVGRV